MNLRTNAARRFLLAGAFAAAATRPTQSRAVRARVAGRNLCHASPVLAGPPFRDF